MVYYTLDLSERKDVEQGRIGKKGNIENTISLEMHTNLCRSMAYQQNFDQLIELVVFKTRSDMDAWE